MIDVGSVVKSPSMEGAIGVVVKKLKHSEVQSFDFVVVWINSDIIKYASTSMYKEELEHVWG